MGASRIPGAQNSYVMFISELPTLLTHCMQFWSYKLRIHPCGISKQRKTRYCSLTVDNPTDKMREETLHIGKRFSVGDLEPWHCLGLGWLGNRLSSATHDGTRSCRTSVILFTVQRNVDVRRAAMRFLASGLFVPSLANNMERPISWELWNTTACT